MKTKISTLSLILATAFYANNCDASQMTGAAGTCPPSISEADLQTLATNPEPGIAVGESHLVISISEDKLKEAAKALNDALTGWKSISPIHRGKVANLTKQTRNICRYAYKNSGAVWDTTFEFQLKVVNPLELDIYKKGIK